ncbi:hypothetical protein NKR23_g8026 [Pleurostoma richardsiae]|uniref:Thioesterase n=1 Tax=Pleurostoma richardsiae TaxID=41990 RepID=A0AA38R9Y5_9PEZI|nr:hypothetical protein NKR23_g8026 [Pleurostoma richardsiae]
MITLASLQEGLSIRRLSSHTYVVELGYDSERSDIPSPGYIASCFLEVSRIHFSTTLAAYHQPHTVAVQLNYLRPTHGGCAVFKVRDLKLGGQTSVVQTTLIDYSGDTAGLSGRLDPARLGDELVTAYLTNTNMAQLKGSSIETNFELRPAPRPVNLQKLREDEDASWKLHGALTFRQTDSGRDTVDLFLEKEPTLPRPTLDHWISFSDGTTFSTSSLGIVADICVAKSDLHDKALALTDLSLPFLYKTTPAILNMDIKKILPAAGAEFLFVRVQSKRIRNGRLDAEILILDPDGDIVAVCNQMTLEERVHTSHRGSMLSKI